MWVLPDRRCSAPRVQIPSIRFSIQTVWVYTSPGAPAQIPTCSSKAAFYLEVGRMENRPEGNGGTTLLASNRHLRDVLRAKGYTIQYAEVYGDHDPVHWRRTLPEALTVMLGN